MKNEALEKSIVHWKEIRDGMEWFYDRFTGSCALCADYKGLTCNRCPLAESGDDCNTTGSTWDQFNFYCDDLDMGRYDTMSTITPAQREILYPLADNMVKKLESLR